MIKIAVILERTGLRSAAHECIVSDSEMRSGVCSGSRYRFHPVGHPGPSQWNTLHCGGAAPRVHHASVSYRSHRSFPVSSYV